MPVEDVFFSVSVYRTDVIPVERSVHLREDYIAIMVRFAKAFSSHRSLSDPLHQEVGLIRHLDLFIRFYEIKQPCHESYYRETIKNKIRWWGIDIPETLYEEILDKLFPVIHATECYKVPIVVVVVERTYWRESDETLSFTPTAQSAVEGLEKVRLDAAIMGQSPMCAICWKDFSPQDIDDQLMVTRMPCSHCYHGDCIVRWLSVNHRCPMCRYPMPVETQLPSSSYNPLRLLN